MHSVTDRRTTLSLYQVGGRLLVIKERGLGACLTKVGVWGLMIPGIFFEIAFFVKM